MDNDQVDWAALAQEWIKMKETNIPSVPTPPSITQNPPSSSFAGGEAPMDMEFKDDGIPPAPPAPNISGADNWNRWNQWESNWNQASIGIANSNWDWNNVSPEVNETLTRIPNNLMIPPPAPVISTTPAFVDHNALSSTVPLESSSLSPSLGYNTMTLPRSHFNNQVTGSGFWNNEQHPHVPGTSTSPFVKDVRQSITRISPSSAALSTLPMMDMTRRSREVKEKTPENDSLNTIDTIKRKQLPAWIREGLEKMEREKQKAIERERQAILHKQEMEACKKIKDQARAVLSPDKSKFDSDSEKELPEYEMRDVKEDNQDDVNKLQKGNYDQNSPEVSRPRKSRFHDASSPEKSSNVVKLQNPDIISNNSSAAIGSNVLMNKEELLQNLMLKVRRSLTEILLEVTNDEINSICEEVWKNFHNKGKMLIATPGNTAPVAQITRRLGLGIYSDSDSESSDEHLIQNQPEKSIPSRNDSDEELKETLRFRQQAFKKTEAEIEANLAEEEENTKDEDQLSKNRKSEILSDRKDKMISNEKNAKDKNKQKIGHATQELNKIWKDSSNRNDSLAAGSRKTSLYNEDEKSSSDNKSLSRGTPDRFNQGEESSSSDSANQSYVAKRKTSHSSNNGKSNTCSSARKARLRLNERAKRYSSSRSRSRSKNDSSSRENSCESSSSKLQANPINTDKTVKKDESRSENYKSSRDFNKKCKSLKSSQYGNPRSRSTSQSDTHFRSESRSRSRSRSRSKSRSRDRSNSTVRSRQRRSRSRSYSSFRKQHRHRSNLHSRSRPHSRSQSQSRSRSRTRSRSKSRNRKRSKSSYSCKSTTISGSKSEGARRRSSRSRSTERARRSRSNTRKSKSSHRQRYRYERDRNNKKSTRHHVD
ncbi:arginine/serine-rich protein PNISR-like isoform X2 [Phymastichus coffea]|nr:arginine/serine-rich protein PNISR-like isoform X2 [Phymastichus coffea]XP_058791101.1 arginine/serine-rich protein PNISR-like isoform X2 [Phymastichus coffea]